jgi:hypothetical protein
MGMRLLVCVSILLFAPAWLFAATVSFESPAQVKTLDADHFTAYGAGQKLDVKSGEGYLILTDNQLPLILFSANSADAKLKLDSAQANAVYQQAVQPYMDKKLNEILSEINNVQSLIQKREYNSAGAQIKILKEKYPRLATIYFLSGTIGFLSNNKTLALEDIEKGLTIDPTNEAAKRLRDKLRGHE